MATLSLTCKSVVYYDIIFFEICQKEGNKMSNISVHIEKYLEYCKYQKKLSEKTLKAYKIDFKQFIEFLREKKTNLNVEKIDKFLIRKYIVQLSDHYAIKSAKRKMACIKAFFNHLEFDDVIMINPFRKVKTSLKEPFRLPVTLSLHEINGVLSEVYAQAEEKLTLYQNKVSIRNIAVFELLFATGVRVGELCNLRKDDIHIDSSYVKVFGKGSRERIVYLNAETLGALERYQNLFDKEISNSKFYFINRRGNRLSEQSVRSVVKKHCSQFGSRKITPHVFRHSFATLMLEEGVDIKYIQEFLGHSSITTTQIYTHVNKTKQMDIVETMHPRNKIIVNKGFYANTR